MMDNHGRCILSSALTRSQDLTSYLAVLYAAVERYGSPTLEGTTTMHTGLRCLLAREEEYPLGEQRAHLLRRQATPHHVRVRRPATRSWLPNTTRSVARARRTSTWSS